MSATQKIKMLLCEDIHDGLSLTSHFPPFDKNDASKSKMLTCQ